MTRDRLLYAACTLLAASGFGVVAWFYWATRMPKGWPTYRQDGAS